MTYTLNEPGNLEREKYGISLNTDQKIDTGFRKVPSVIHILNTKAVKNTKNSAAVYIEYNPLVNLEIPQDQFEKFREDHYTVADSDLVLG